MPGCKSNSKVPGHFFPKNPILSVKWKEVVNNSIISNASSEDLRKFRVCHLHFLPEDYIYSLNRRRLKHNAVPSLNICNIQTVNTEINDVNMTEQQSRSEICTTELDLESETNTTELHLQPQTSHGSNESHQTCTNDFIREETSALQTDQDNIANEIINRPSTPSTSRNILGSITRKNHLTPTAQKLYKKAVGLTKERNRMKRQIAHYKIRLADARKFSNTQFCHKFNSLTPTQQLFFNMQLRNTKYNSKVNNEMLFNELKSTLKLICPERSSQYLNNISFEL